MDTAIRILSALLIAFSVYMGFKHGLAMAMGRPEMIEMFGKWNVSKSGIQLLGIIGLAATVMLFFPKTFVWGNIITSAMILFIMAQFLHEKNLKGFLIELPFFLLPLLLIYLQHPLKSANG